MPFVEVNGTRLAYVEEGKGDPVFFVHGSLADLRSWSQQMEPFSRRLRAIAYSRRYHYPNPSDGNGDYSAALHARDLATLIEAVVPGPAHVVATSFGAYAALLLAAERPALVRSLVLGEPPLLPWLREIPGGAPLLEAFMSTAWEPSKGAFQQGDARARRTLFSRRRSGIRQL